MQQVPAIDQKTSIFHRHIARHLLHPRLIRMTGDSGQAYPPALQMNEKQHVVGNQPAQRKHFHGEEVGGHQYRHVSTDKVFPTRRLLPLGSRWNIMAAKNIAHRLIREPQTQVGHGAHDPVISPPGIFLRHPHHQPLAFLSTLGRPRDLRDFDPSNLVAMSFRYQASSVSGFATAASSSKAFRPSRWAISANVAFSASDNNNRPLIWALRIRFSAARYSFLNRSSWSTVPVM